MEQEPVELPPREQGTVTDLTFRLAKRIRTDMRLTTPIIEIEDALDIIHDNLSAALKHDIAHEAGEKP